MLKTKDGVVSQSIYRNARRTVPILLHQFLLSLGFFDLVVSGCLVIGDDPFVRETGLVNVMIPKSGRGDFCSDDRPFLDTCDSVDSESSCEFYLESRKVAGSRILSNGMAKICW